jgi:hypothetical protein
MRFNTSSPAFLSGDGRRLTVQLHAQAKYFANRRVGQMNFVRRSDDVPQCTNFGLAAEIRGGLSPGR